MTPVELKLFKETIAPLSVYLEFGSGASTKRALNDTSVKVYTVDSDPKWLESVSVGADRSRLYCHYVDIGKTKLWGYPINDKDREQYPLYSSSIFAVMPTIPDAVLIDGRFRVACALKSIINNVPIIMIHDFWNRKQYHVLLKYLIKTGAAGTLGVFRLNKRISLDDLAADYEDYKYNPA